MAEELTEFLLNHNVKAAYIHSDVATLDRENHERPASWHLRRTGGRQPLT